MKSYTPFNHFLPLNNSKIAHNKPLLRYHGTFSDVEIEEITVEYSLNTSGDDSNEVEEALGVVAVDPVEYVQSTVAAQCKQIVTGDGLRLTGLTDHEQLRQDCNRLQVDGKRPQNLKSQTEQGVVVVALVVIVVAEVVVQNFYELT